ncbi:putative nuclease of restriction endonuclease-like (RecB) superfamily [Anseongella ginsenosidimutans]|uniref:Putative nuclease of restriction endonuclease-like (RecB) superfamily n=1 Tax=Anseongella ginsenosidimutans TaxID=496056 RepID=A0A4R3KQL6_9SPHI|nr:PDDEXK nuclease domain-containing protein [Anseongella ginsenosidimutans]QEC52591.1 DUF1016 domain-containing protein [Anseongella ginsenosidimutans]TCS86509.1 putative nuclease of restriction endonuclease-like (RecB) superfamily [Anseongella ginsenosidimutans]
MKNFEHLLSTIENVHQNLQGVAVNAVNQALTMRNWLIGYYIVEFEQSGEDRAKYGTGLIENVANKLSHIKGIDKRSLFRFREFYLFYPQLREILSDHISGNKILETLRTKDSLRIVGTVSPQLEKELQVPPDKLISKLSYSHLELLLNIDDPLKRTFYEVECIKGTWSVRELKRQINSLYFERSGLSSHPEKLANMIRQKIVPQAPKDVIKNVYAFEFLDISTRSVVEESDLETALLDHLQQFIIELGNGFCLEARQKRILIGESYYFIDLVFYHRILKSHILLELKIGAFEHGDIGQLNTYLNYYKDEVCEDNDNPPVGILLVAEKDHALVKYATAGMDENLFIQKYMVRLPDMDHLKKHIEEELRNLITDNKTF